MEFLNFRCKCRKSAKGKTPKREHGEGRKGEGDDETRHSFHFIDGVRNGRNGKWSMGNGAGGMGCPDEDENENGNGDGDGDGDESGQRERD